MRILLLLMVLGFSQVALSDVSFVGLKSGAVISPIQHIYFQVKGMDVRPAGVSQKNTGHHHLIVDGTFFKEGKIIPADTTHFHFGKWQTGVTLTLSPGKHTLTLQFGNALHQSYGKKWSKTISVVVK